MQSHASTVIVLGTGGTIAGVASDAFRNVGYSSAQLAVADLVSAIPALAGAALEAEQVAQLDSKDMSHAVWRHLAQRCAEHLARPEVAGLVITHGTDTLEETAWFLQRVLAPAKPVVLTAAMRPATALQSDGPQNLLDAVAVARVSQARGVMAVLGGQVHTARDVRKIHPYRIAAFGSGEAGLLGVVEEGVLRRFRGWPEDAAAVGLDALPQDAATWPRVEIVASHAGATGAVVRALCADGVQGLAIAATGNGSLHADLEAALRDARRRGVRLLISSRCGDGRIVAGTDPDASLPTADDLTPAKARVELMLRLLAAGVTAAQVSSGGSVS